MTRRACWWVTLFLVILFPSREAIPEADTGSAEAIATARAHAVWSETESTGGAVSQAQADLEAFLQRTVPPDKRISVDFREANLSAILRAFSEVGGIDIVASPEVKGRMTVSLSEVPWAAAFNMLLKANGLAAVEEDGVLRVNTAQNLANEELSLRSAERRREELLPLTTQMIRLVYAKAEELKPPLQRMLSPRGTLEVDPRTNMLLVVDIPQNVERISEMVGRLDTNTAQVEITAKLVDVDATIVKELGIEWTATGLTHDGVDATGEAGVAAGLAEAAGSFKVSTFAADGNLDATLEMLQRDNKAKIISNPRITTLDNQEAKIIVGKKIPLVVTDEAGNAITQLTTIGIKMTVVPHINSEDWITLELHPEVSDLSAQATVQGGIIIVTSEASTRVVVRDGDTAVIGGLIRQNETSYITGVPVLKDLPLLGHLFRSSSNSTESRELVIFVTPRIVRAG